MADYGWQQRRNDQWMSERDHFEHHLEQSMLFGTPKPKRNTLMRQAKKFANWTVHCGSPPSSPEPHFESTVQYRASVAYPNTTIVVQNTANTPYVPSVHLPPAHIGPAPSTTATSFVQLPVIPPVEHHAEYMPTPLPIIPTYRASPTAKPANPWAPDEYDNVLDGKHMPTALADIAITIHPTITMTAEPSLIVDLRLSRAHIWKRPKPGYDEVPEQWKGHDESATLPKLNFMILLCPLFDAPIRVENDEGITCEILGLGDVINALFGLAQAPISDERWKALPYLEKQQARSLAPSTRGPALAWSVLDPLRFVHLDTWHGQVTFAGLRRDSQYVKRRMGWANPVCFVVELARPVHSFKYE
ncbi:hypothetical protein M407DRAFT_9502 [Tulasnella calospora MUT 4182]|uniref:Uncharacterized protein n=1 Tax=Tulasnella calospora MUT 4182 TaxID=1051891 RepID=A0A0C3KPB2_9AGAM|nr:hypothetical protein M407DRAFT_9502 [Tulasnella calospora MUT 4182]